jgi:hypothetical protein
MSFKTNQVSVDTTAGGVLLAAARPGRRKLVVVNHGTTAVYLGAAGVATTTGVLLHGAAGAERAIETDQAVYGIVAASSQTVSVLEVW